MHRIQDAQTWIMVYCLPKNTLGTHVVECYIELVTL